MSRAVLDDVKYRGSATPPLPDVELPGQRVELSTLQTVVMRYATAGRMAPGRRVLELGCGPGLGLQYLAECGASRVVGADRSAVFLRMARERSTCDEMLVRCDAEALPFRDASFDVVLLMEMLMYFQDPAAVLRETRRILDVGGEVFLSLPNAAKLGLQAKGERVRFYSAGELEGLLVEAGFHSQAYGVFPSAGALGRKPFWHRAGTRVLNSLEHVGLPPALRQRMTAAVLRRNAYQLPFRITAAHRLLLPAEGARDDNSTGIPEDCRVVYALGRVLRP